MVAEQPLIKPVVTSNGAVVVSGHPLASEAGRLAFEKGGNVVDAMIAVSFALGVVEPEASGIGGDGAAVLFLKGMKQPTVIDYKDMTPIRATADNPPIMQDGRIVADGPAAANIPGVVAGLDYLYRNYGSGKVKWDELVAPAITLADEGFILDEALPTSIAEGRRFLEKWPEAAKIYLPGGKVPRPGDRFFNKDYANTLRAIPKDGADTFYRGEIARRSPRTWKRTAASCTFADLAQYRAIEREPVVGHAIAATRCMPAARRSPRASSCSSRCTCSRTTSRRPGARTSTDADYFHYLIESWKVRDPMRRVADPERWPVEFAEHLTLEHAKKLFAKIDREEGVALRADAAGRSPTHACRTGAAHRHRDDVVCRRRCRRQHDRGDADAEHVGRHVLRVEGTGLSLQQSPAVEPDDAGRLRQPDAADAIDHGGVPTLVFARNAAGEEVPSWRWVARATPGFRCRSTTSSPA